MPNDRLLVLDDDASINFTICAIAESAGFQTRSTTSTDEFFDLVAQWQPSHTIVDLVMPGVDGVETLRLLSETDYTGKVIIASGLGTRVLEAAGRAAAENGLQLLGVLPKPFTPTNLRTLLATVLPDAGQASVVREKDTFEITEATLARALEKAQLCVYYQPKVSVRSGRLVGFEALARWQHPEAGLIMPDSFIHLAEQSGLIHTLTRQVFEKSLTWFAPMFRDTDAKLALNISPLVLVDDTFPGWILNLCEQHEISPQQVILEITETSTMESEIRMLEFTTQFRIRGFHVALDDFGVGYSSLVELARLPFSELKIDKMFVMTAANSIESQKISAAIISLGHALNLQVTAEGVEDEWTLRFLRELNCDFAQGYYFSRPLPESAVAEWIKTRKKLADG